MRASSKMGVGGAVLGAFAMAAIAHADSVTKERALELDDERTLGGYGTKLNFRGVGEEFNIDATLSTAPNRDAVEALRASARFQILPEPLRSVGWWGIWAGVRAGAYRFERSANPTDSPPGGLALANVEPTFGIGFTTPGDRLRFEIDLAPAISMASSKRTASQAALVAALSTGPHDDLLFLPNLDSAGRLRLVLSRRWDFGTHFAIALGTEVEVGHARTQTPFGAAEGETGGGELGVSFYLRHVLPFIEGVIVQPTGDVGYTSVWSSDVVLPMRLGVTVTFAVVRTFEFRIGAATFAPSAITAPSFLDAFDSWATTLGVRWSFDRSPPTWTRRHIDLEPDVQGLETK